MRNRSIIAVTLLVIVGALAWLLIPSSIVMARAEKQSHGRTYSVVVKRLGDRFETELRDGKFLVSSYAFYEGSVPPTNAVITWQTVDELLVTFDVGMSLRCSWDASTRDRLCWTCK